MKKGFAALLTVLLLFCFAACEQPAGTGSGSEKQEEEQTSAVLPGAFVPDGRETEDLSGQSASDTGKKSRPYDPSIFVIEASGSWRQELAPGYYADYECELYLDKFDANDSRSASGVYSGVFWMKTALDTADYLKEFLKDVPVEMGFEAGGEGVCDNLTMHLLDGYERDPFKDFGIPDGKGGKAVPDKEALAGEGGFIAVGTRAYLDARAQGAAGETLTHQDSQTGDAELRYIIQVEPDVNRTATEREVTIYLTGAEGMSATIEGVWKRLPGYRDDMHEYAKENKAGQMLEKHLK
ncbi:MAG TPA: hypothetical protein VN366_02715 [Feifaniaceae bacterium]|nr:hypothetical protein [Feifaniaceae bacterium]